MGRVWKDLWLQSSEVPECSKQSLVDNSGGNSEDQDADRSANNKDGNGSSVGKEFVNVWTLQKANFRVINNEFDERNFKAAQCSGCDIDTTACFS